MLSNFKEIARKILQHQNIEEVTVADARKILHDILPALKSIYQQSKNDFDSEFK